MSDSLTDRQIAAFRPGLLSILDAAPSPTARLTALLLCSAVAAALTWGWVGTIDMVAVSTGQVVPAGQVKQIQPSEAGVVRAIHVTEGQIVPAGAPLVDLDPTQIEGDLEAASIEAAQARLDAARLSALLARPDAPDLAFTPPDGAEAGQILVQRSMMQARAAEQAARLRNAEAEIRKRRAEAASHAAEAAKLEALLPILERRVAARRTLVDRQAGSEMAYLELHQQWVEQRAEVAVHRQRQQQSEADAAAAEASRDQVQAEYQRSLNSDLAEATRKAASAEASLGKARRRLDLTRLTAPVAGQVQQLGIATVGGVVTAAQPLMVLVPSDAPLEVRAQLPNKDIGFVRPGQPVKVKIESFTFTRYGHLTGRVASLSADAVKDEKQGLVYTARIALDRDTMTIDGHPTRLTPGMAVTAEIVTGNRRLLDYVFAPITKALDEAGRER